MREVDVLVVGGGIAGASIAWALAADASVRLLEREPALGVHATGRSAATFVESLESAPVRALTMAGRAFLEHPPEGFGPSPLSPLPMMYVARPGDLSALVSLAAEIREQVPDVQLLDAAATEAACAYLRPGAVAGGLLEPRAQQIDVDALHQGFVRGLRERGGEVRRACGLGSASYATGAWAVVDTTGEEHRAAVLVNAAGAWGDQVAAGCGVAPIGLQPYRRTIFAIPAPPGVALQRGRMPMVVDVGGTCYVKPEVGQFLCSPMDQTPSEPVDARPDQLDIARGMDVVDELTVLAPRHVSSSWAGLRSYVADRLPVVGFAADHPAFFWLVGQGGFGVQTSPSMARLGAALVAGRDIPPDLQAAGVSAERLGPDRPGLGARPAAGPFG